jgi:tRNA G18 (ribose-2'-O)-methylase SpoU
LGAEETVHIKQFNNTADALQEAKTLWCVTIAAEITPEAIDLQKFSWQKHPDIAVVFGNEVDGVLEKTLQAVDHVVYIPMQGNSLITEISKSP